MVVGNAFAYRSLRGQLYFSHNDECQVYEDEAGYTEGLSKR